MGMKPRKKLERRPWSPDLVGPTVGANLGWMVTWYDDDESKHSYWEWEHEAFQHAQELFKFETVWNVAVYRAMAEWSRKKLV